MNGRSYAVTASEVERYRSEHLGRRGGFHDPNHPRYGEQGPGRGRQKKIVTTTDTTTTSRRLSGRPRPLACVCVADSATCDHAMFVSPPPIPDTRSMSATIYGGGQGMETSRGLRRRSLVAVAGSSWRRNQRGLPPVKTRVEE